MNIKHRFIKNTFFPSTIIKWNKLDPAIWNSTSFNSFKVSILTFTRRAPKGIFQCRNSKRITYFRRLRLYFSYLHDHKFKLSFPDNINSLCTSSLEVETSNDFILYCPYYKNEPLIPLSSICSIKSSILDQNDNDKIKVLLYRLDSLSETQDTWNGILKVGLSRLRKFLPN